MGERWTGADSEAMLRTSLMRQLEEAHAEVERLRADLALLFAVYEAWMNADIYDPGNMPGIASLLGTEGAAAMEDATDAVDPHASRIRELLRVTSRATGEDGTDG